MKSLHEDGSRHTVIDGREAHYLSFPDVALLSTGRLVAVYREADGHVARRRRILARTSDDGGRTWDGPHLVVPSDGHCPRLTALEDDVLALICDDPSFMAWSLDGGVTWMSHPANGLHHGIPDRVLALDRDTLLTLAQLVRGSAPSSTIGQALTEVACYRSTNRGRDWELLTLAGSSRHLTLCEPSVARLNDGRLLALMRENSMVFEPMYLAVSEDEGATWSEPIPTPLIGHRPCMGVTADGRVLVTYRNVAPEGGQAGWLGAPDELLDCSTSHSGFPQGVTDGEVHLDNEWLEIESDTDSPVLFALRPLSDPATARASLEAEVEALESSSAGVGLKLGIWWRIEPDRIVPLLHRARPVPLTPGRPHVIRISYDAGRVTLRVDGRKRRSYTIAHPLIALRAVMWGTPPRPPFLPRQVCPPERFWADPGPTRSRWRSVRLQIEEDRFLRRYAWTWSPADGLPDAWARDRILTLRSGRPAAWADYGYSGWVETAPGSFLCAYHWADGQDPDYRRGGSSLVACTRFSTDDFQR